MENGEKIRNLLGKKEFFVKKLKCKSFPATNCENEQQEMYIKVGKEIKLKHFFLQICDNHYKNVAII